MSHHLCEISYGPWERAEEIKSVIDPSYGLEGRWLGMRLFHVLRRRVYEIWQNENGERIGRWTWEYSEPV